MNKPWFWIVIAIVVIAVIVGIVLFMVPQPSSPGDSGTASSTIVSYSCGNGESIAAAYGSSSVALTLSDGRTLALPQTLSGSGIRYEAGSGTGDDVVFASEGANAFLMENGTTTYNDCVVNAAAGQAGANGSTTVFTDQGNAFSFDYPSQFSVSGGGAGYTQSWMQNTTSSGMILAQLSLPRSFASGTNFAGATFTVGTSADPSAIANCLSQTNGNIATSTQVSINGTPFSEITYGDAGAGNFYDIVSYRTLRNSQCYAVGYVIHSTNIGNYPPGTVTQFDAAQVENVMNGLVQSFRFL